MNGNASSRAMSAKERMAIPRQPMPEQEASVRRHNFDEVPFGYDAQAAVREAQRCLACGKPKCIEGCPVNIDIPRFITQIAEGDFRGAARTLKASNLLPSICGRVCPQEEQCEALCVVGKKHAPVAIGRLERFIGDWERENGAGDLPVCAPPSGRRVAVVGSGPAGLTVAADLARLGHQVTVFEAFHKPGGVLTYGIPEFRLPKAIVDAEVSLLEKLGVEIRYNQVIGLIHTVDDLLQNGYDAVFIGTGAGLPWFLNIPGENACGVYSANEFLTRTNLMRAYEFPESDTPVFVGRSVATVGGGNVAMDAARTALRLGAEHSYVLYRRGRVEMPARAEEIEHAEAEGVEFHFLLNPVRILADDEGWVSGIECCRMMLGEPDESGRRRPVPIANSEFVFDVETVVIAIGNSPNPLIRKTTPEIATKKWGEIIVDPATMKTSKRAVFAGGDIVQGAATVILAMGDGRRAAAAIDEYLRTGVW